MINKPAWISRVIVWAGLLTWSSWQSGVMADEPIKKLILPGEAFLVEGRPSFIFTPRGNLLPGPRPWVFYAPTLEGYPDDHEKWMHEQILNAGVAVAGIDVASGWPSLRSYCTWYAAARVSVPVKLS